MEKTHTVLLKLIKG